MRPFAVSVLILSLGTILRLLAVEPASTPGTPSPNSFELTPDGRWLMQPESGRYDASALLRLPDGRLLTVNDKEIPPCVIVFGTNHVARLVPERKWFPLDAVRAAVGRPRYAPDIEGLAIDDQGRLYLCTEGPRWIFRTDPDGQSVERLPIDWTPVQRWFSTNDANASWEGIAVGGNRLYLANERSTGRIVEVDLSTFKVVHDFQVAPQGNTSADVHYSDLSWFAGELWVLCRDLRKILRVAPSTRSVIAEYDFAAAELSPQNIYLTALPYGFAEGLSVDATHLWVAFDNNGMPRRSAPTDFRPLLLRFPRPDRPVPSAAQDPISTPHP
jgi:Esterase-like activity of phytase